MGHNHSCYQFCHNIQLVNGFRTSNVFIKIQKLRMERERNAIFPDCPDNFARFLLPIVWNQPLYFGLYLYVGYGGYWQYAEKKSQTGLKSPKNNFNFPLNLNQKFLTS